MEVIGQGFNLPLEDMHITNDDVSIYAQWLFEPSMRPAAVVNEGLEQELYQIIFHQFSLLFQPRIPRSPSSQNPQHPNNPSVGRPNSFNINGLPVNLHTNVASVNMPMPATIANAAINTTQQPTGSSAATPNVLKNTISQLVQRHVELCKRTLTVFATAGRSLELTPDTWTVLLKVILGITDSLLREPMGDTSIPGVVNMGDQLCDHLLRVLCELWLRSETKEVEMWDIFKDCFMRWTHRPKVIQQWSATCLALSRCVSGHLAEIEECYVLIMSVSGVQVKLDLPKPFLYYAWHRFVYLIPHPLQLAPHNFNLAMIGIGQLVSALNQRHNRVASADVQMPPSGNTLLNMFGTWLFDVCSKTSQNDPESHRGFAEAFATLCKIFCRPQPRQPFLRTYTERFYAALCLGLKVDACIPTILMNCTELFAIDLEGVRMLVPDFISAIKMVLPKLNIQCKCFVSVDDLRLAALKVISTVMCLPNHFEKVELKPGWDYDLHCASDNASLIGEQEQLVTQLIRVLYADKGDIDVERPFTCLKFYILELLLMSLRTETSSYNMRYIFHLINVYVVEDVPFCPGLVGTVVKLIQDKILTMKLPPDVTLVAFDVLMDFVDLYDYVKRDSKVRQNEAIATGMTRTLNTILSPKKNVARELVLALSRYVDTLINAGKLLHTYPLIVQAYDCMMKWVLVSQWIIDDRDCYQAVIATLSRGITLFDRDTDSVQVEVSSEKKKNRRDTTFPPAKQLFLLPPRVNKNNNHNNNSNNSNNTNSNNNNNSNSTNTADQQTAPSLPPSRSGSVNHKKEEIAVRMAAEYCMSQFVNQLGKFQSLHDHSLVRFRSTQRDDLCFLREHRAKQGTDVNTSLTPYETVRYFLVDKRMILAIIDLTNAPHKKAEEPKGKPSVLLIIRDTTGSYMWEMDAAYRDPDTSAFKVSISPPPSNERRKSDPQNQPSLYHTYESDDDYDDGFVVPTATAVNESELPSLDKLFKNDSEDMYQWDGIKVFMEQQKNVILQKSSKELMDKHAVYPSTPNIDNESPRGFRLLLSQIGFLLPQNREQISPIQITDSSISELETLDMLNERDCISVSVYYALSGNTNWTELVESPPPLSPLYLQFLHCLGWPVELANHNGFKGNLDPSICEKAPYYSDRSAEFVVNVPYMLHQPPGTNESIIQIHQRVSIDDHVCIVWIEDLVNYDELSKKIKNSSLPTSKIMVYIFINPLKKSADGLYRIRIHIPSYTSLSGTMAASQRLNENALLFGPLVDGIVVSRHALGAMVRNTAISAHQACRVVTDTYTRPYVIRKQFIEEMGHRHRVKLPLSEFYSDIFSENRM
ncbi:hypothetical protein CLU79DRAFT_724841 [Phycomyces nitens]|nr:hypothetical protein CLU79DRAFT_724841 [Phycomyces nitens]